jgi:UDP-glucose 4-epimerase
MKVIVTGGYGFVGSKIVKRLLNDGHEVVILEHPNSKPPVNFPKSEVILCDITSESDMMNLSTKDIDAVLHLAAQSSGPKSFSIPELDLDINIFGTLNIIKMCRNNFIPRILFASSFVVYGDGDGYTPCKEVDPTFPKSVYATSKLACEHLLKNYAEPLGIRWNALRMFNIYGPGQDLMRQDQGLVAIFLGNILRSNELVVNGSLERYRDLVHIDDVVEGWMSCLNTKDCSNGIYNLASGEKITFKRLIDLLIEFCGKSNFKVIESGTTQGDILGCYADVSKIKRDIGFSPKYTPEMGIANFVRWAKNQ